MAINKPALVSINYGRGTVNLPLDYSIADWEVIQSNERNPIADIDSAFHSSVENPISSEPLSHILARNDKVVIVTSDGTRPVPNKFLIPAIIRHCRLRPENVTILVGTGTHRPPSKTEFLELFGSELMNECQVISHNAETEEGLEYLGESPGGIPVFINRKYLGADKKIVIGFIEPHFFAGFSGGAKGICPALCGLETINAFHSFDIIGHPYSEYGELERNPQQVAARQVAAMATPDFLINVTLNSRKEITGIFSGNYIEAHYQGAEESKLESMIEVPGRYPIVITSNAGYPLDQNLYQTVKGIATAGKIVEDNGEIIVVSECSKGIPDDGNFAKIMGMEKTPEDLLARISERSFQLMDRWQAQKLATILLRANISLISELSDAQTRLFQMQKAESVPKAVLRAINRLGAKPVIAVIPNGPSAIPYLPTNEEN